jgi:hypothetical protein
MRTFFCLPVFQSITTTRISIDVHAASQLVITLNRLERLGEFKPVVEKVTSWIIDHVQSRKGYFYYQKAGGIRLRFPICDGHRHGCFGFIILPEVSNKV